MIKKTRGFLPNFTSFGYSVSEEKIISKSTNQKQEILVTVMQSVTNVPQTNNASISGMNEE